MVSFIFGGENMPKTPQELARLRQMAEALSPSRRVPQNVGEGLSAIGQAIASRIIAGRADRAERAGVDAANSAFAGLFTPSATADTTADTTTTPSSTVDMTPADSPAVDTSKANVIPVPGTTENARSIDRGSVQDYAGMSLKSGIKSAADSLGISPEDLATAISYETAGTFDPMKKGPRTKWGQHKGLIQFGEPQAKEYGVDWSKPMESQLGPEGAVVKYLRANGVKPGMGLMDIYSAINAGGVNRYNATDANNGGAWGTVADKVNYQMGGHRKKALALLADKTNQSPFDAQPNLNAKTVSAPVPVVDVPEGFQQPDPLETEAKPVDVADNSNYFPPAPVKETRKKVVEALTRKPATSDFDVMKAIEVMNNPFLDDGKKAVAAALIKRRFEEQDAIAAEQRRLADPKYQMDLEKGRLELDALKNPKKARTLSDAEEKALGLDTSGIYQEMPDGSLKTVRDPSKPIDALNAEKAQIEVNNLKNPPKLAELSADDKKALGLPLDGVYQRKPDGSIVTVREPEKATADWSKLDDGRLFNQRTGEIKDVAGQTVGFRFPGDSPEAAALNGLIDNGTLTEKQAMDIAAGKQLTGPNGEIIFATPQALIGAQPQVTEPQVRDDGGIDIFAGQTPDVPVDAKTPTTATDKPVDAVPVMEQPNSGMVPLTAPKVTVDERKAAGFADRMAQSGKILDSLEDFAANPDTKWDQVKNSIPFGVGNLLTSEDFKKFDQAKRDFINAQLRRESGAVISDSEFANAEQQYFPQPGDPPDVIKQKRDLRKKVVESMMRDAGPTYKPPVTEDAKPETKDDAPPADLPDDMKELWKFMTPEERKLWQN